MTVTLTASSGGRLPHLSELDVLYPGRTPHIHMKVHVGGTEVHTGQLFFSDATSAAVYRTSAYAGRGEADTTNGTTSDPISTP